VEAVVRTAIIAGSAALALAAAGCGAERDHEAQRPVSGSAGSRPAAPKPTGVDGTRRTRAREPRTLIVFRRVRYEGATMRILSVRADGSLKIDIPNGGAGGAKFNGRLTRRALRAVRHDLAATPWRHLSRRRTPYVPFNTSGAYFMIHRAGRDYVAMASGMSPDLLPIVRRLNEVLSGKGQSRHNVVHRFLKI
jgi:hypothetical protein